MWRKKYIYKKKKKDEVDRKKLRIRNIESDREKGSKKRRDDKI